MTATMIPVLAFAFLMTLAALKDAMSFTIPNWLSGAVALVFPLAAALMGIGWAEFGLHLAVGVGALVLGMALYAPGWIGGGDAKLIAAAALWFGWPDAVIFLGKSALMGGALAVTLLMLRRIVPATRLSAGWVARTPLAEGAPAPYGIALAAGALWTLPGSALLTTVGL
ncbi:A24 family peptidase [Hyphobacterium marinum]|uniref:Prepilin peptidase n=1 Tax=Hyphobacterium marinum TaxID=3116574 RepID=A0ABU7LW87_9PROT|nr:prepilin peptidase [Hyphobacterium sp. Y6023]MEE2565790.1 prepilin peptidase [Hyphobacterium sp. Y6023]